MGDLYLGTSGKKGNFEAQALPWWSGFVEKTGPLGHFLAPSGASCEVSEFVPLNP